MTERNGSHWPKDRAQGQKPRSGARATRGSAQAKSRPKKARAHRGGRWQALKRALGSVAFTLSTALLGLFFWSVFSRPAKYDEHWIVFEVGATEDQVLRELYHEQLIDSPWLMEMYLRYLTPFSRLRPGLHLLEQGLTPRQLAQRLTGDPARRTENVTLIEGWNRWDIADRLHEKGIVPRRAFLQIMEDRTLLAELGISAASAEGYLFPATYPLPLDSEAASILKTLVGEMRKRIERIKKKSKGELQHPGSAFSEEELLILASIVEKETGRALERPRVAQVFLNRLAHPEAETLGRLQSDPTAAYGCRLAPQVAPSCVQFSGKVTPAVLADAANPYNTYRHPGLPPGAIGNPGSESIQAVLFPSGGEELFFVADGQGGHTFSRTFEEHRNAVKQLRDQRGANLFPPK